MVVEDLWPLFVQNNGVLTVGIYRRHMLHIVPLPRSNHHGIALHSA